MLSRLTTRITLLRASLLNLPGRSPIRSTAERLMPSSLRTVSWVGMGMLGVGVIHMGLDSAALEQVGLLSSAARAADSYPSAGELVFSEFMINPATSSSNEWVELYSRATGARRLDGCVLREGTSGSGCLINGVQVAGNCFTLPTSTPVSVAAGDFALLANDAAYLSSTCSISAKADTSTVTLNNSGQETMDLYCPGESGTLVLITSMSYRWDTLGGTKGQSWQLSQEALVSGDASNPSSWCLAAIPDLQTCSTVVNGATVTDYGTPGTMNVCPVYVPPPPVPVGGVIFSELNVYPTSSTAAAEWLELKVLSAPNEEGRPPVQLNGCQLKVSTCGSLDSLSCLAQANPSFTTNVTLLASADAFPLVEGATLALGGSSSKTCLSYDPLDINTCLKSADVVYGTDVLFNSDRRLLELACPDENGTARTIDRVVYEKSVIDAECKEADEHCSWELRAASLDAVSNDDGGSWGAAPASALYAPAFEDGLPQQAYGTPGGDNAIGPRTYAGVLEAGMARLSELNIWPGSDPLTFDWIELEILADLPEGTDYFDLSTCELRTVSCETLDPLTCVSLEVQDSGWKSKDLLDSVEDGLLVTGPQRVLLGSSSSKTCAEVDTNGVCLTSVQGYFSSTIGLSNTETRLLELACPDSSGLMAAVDRVVYSKTWTDDVCGREDNKCSWELRPTAEEMAGREIIESDNDDPRAWSTAITPFTYGLENGAESTSNGTPGRDNSVELAAPTSGYPEPGWVAFSELMVAPSGSEPEWLELKGLEASEEGMALELAGCMLLLGDVEDDVPAACTPTEPGSCDAYLLPTYRQLPIAQGEYRVLSLSQPCLSYETSPERCAVPADLTYSELLFSNSTTQDLMLWCPKAGGGWQEIDRFRYDWDAYSDTCAANSRQTEGLAACSVAVQPEFLSASLNDDPYYRCVSSVEGNYQGSDGMWIAASPGKTNVCPALPSSPEPGSVIFTEIMIQPRNNDALSVEAHEWFELLNVTSDTYDFRACELVRDSLLEGDVINLGARDSVSLVLQEALSEPGVHQVWALDGCVLAGPDGCEQPEDGAPSETTLAADVAYSGLTFSNDARQRLAIECVGPADSRWVVDEFIYDAGVNRVEEGHSWQLGPEFYSAAGNDTAENWCEASFQQCFFSAEDACNYGTPGKENACGGRVLYDGDVAPSCRCEQSPAERGAAGRLGQSLLLMMALLGWARRRVPHARK